MEAIKFFGTIIIAMYVLAKISNFIKDLQAKKEIENILKEIEILKKRNDEVSEYEKSIDESVKAFRREDECRNIEQADIRKEKNRERYKFKNKHNYKRV